MFLLGALGLRNRRR